MRLNMRRLYGYAMAWIFSLSMASAAHAGAKIVMTDDVFIGFNVLLQPQFNLGVDPPGTASAGFRFQPQLRRARFAVNGQVTSGINFFLQVDSPAIGLNSDWTPRYYPLDAYVELDVDPALQIDTGILLLPFSHHGMQGAPTLLGVDFGGTIILEPPQITDKKGVVYPTTLSTWRDAGVMLRGLFAKDMLEYRLAVTTGVTKQLGGSNLNLSGLPRVTGRLTFNFFASEAGSGPSGFFYDGLYLENHGEQLISPKKILSVGGGASYQHQAVLRGAQAVDYTAYNVDLFWDIPLGDAQQALNGQVNWFYYGAAGGGSNHAAQALFAEAGYRYDRIEPVLAVECVIVQGSTAGNSLYWRGGVNFWLVGHNASIKLDAGAKSANNGAGTFAGRIQTQLFF